MTDQPYVVALDVGGSLTKIAAAELSGETSPVERLPTPVVRCGPPAGNDGPDELVRWLARCIIAYAEARPGRACRGFSVAVPGILDASGTVRAAPNLGWTAVPVRGQLVALTQLPGVVGHDVRCGGLAEWRLGAGVGVTNLLFLPLGTGIAGALVVDGRLLEADGYAGEVGHIPVPAAGELPCLCGQHGCLETVASAPGVVRSYLRYGGDPAATVDAATVADRARGGDPAARAAYATAAQALAEALVLCLTLLGPELVVLGGGLAGAADLLVDDITRRLQDRLTFQRRPRIVPAALGADAGVLGAGLLGWQHLRTPEAPS